MQGQMWGIRARDWAEVQESMFAPLFEEVLRNIGVGPGTLLLDIGCGSCIFCQMADGLGAQVSGLDATEPLLDIARERLPQGDFTLGEMEELPYPDQSFDVVTGFNSFQYAASPLTALKEAHRVLKSGGLLVIAVWGKPEDNEVLGYFKALSSLMPPPPPGMAGPFALSVDGELETLVSQAGLRPGKIEEVECLWDYPDDSTVLRGLLSAGPAIRVIQHAGEEATRQAVLEALAPFKTNSGGYQLRNKARYMIVKK
jgi:SAM-dependent methyltransferase